MDKSRAVKRLEIKVEVTELYLPAYVIGCLFAEVLMFFPNGQGAFSPSFAGRAHSHTELSADPLCILNNFVPFDSYIRRSIWCSEYEKHSIQPLLLYIHNHKLSPRIKSFTLTLLPHMPKIHFSTHKTTSSQHRPFSFPSTSRIQKPLVSTLTCAQLSRPACAASPGTEQREPIRVQDAL